MTTTDNAFTATGTGTSIDFLALATEEGNKRPSTGFQTMGVKDNNFWFGGVFGGTTYGATEIGRAHV